VRYRRRRSACWATLWVSAQIILLLAGKTLGQEKREREEDEGWPSHSHDAQHTGISAIKSQPLDAIHWQMPVDLNPQVVFGDLFIHYGSPLVTPKNTVIVPVKTGAFDGFRVEARNGADGEVKWMLDTDYSVPLGFPFSSFFTPAFGPVLTKSDVALPAAGGTVLIRDHADLDKGKVTRMAFYGIGNFQKDPATFSSAVQINTPITADKEGNLFFGFIVNTPNPLGLQSGLARVGLDGQGSWISATVASRDPSITKVSMSCAPALSKDERNVYVSVNSFDFGFGYLLELDASTLQPINRVRLIDPQSGLDAAISDSSSATPTVGPDGDVYYGVLENPFPFHNDRGWLLHFSADLQEEKTPGGFGWDDTPSIVPASMVDPYHGTSRYLLMTKYNNYFGVGSGDGVNKIAILDPNASMPDLVLGNPVMNEVLTITGRTPDTRPGFPPGAVREWCINTAAVDPFTKSILANSEDGKLYRWDLTTNSFSQVITITGGIGEAYTPTVIGADGTVYAINNATLFAIGTQLPCKLDINDKDNCKKGE